MLTKAPEHIADMNQAASRLEANSVGAGFKRALLAKPDCEVKRGFHRTEISPAAALQIRTEGLTDARSDAYALRPPVRSTRYTTILPHALKRGLQSRRSIVFYLHKSNTWR